MNVAASRPRSQFPHSSMSIRSRSAVPAWQRCGPICAGRAPEVLARAGRPWPPPQQSTGPSGCYPCRIAARSYFHLHLVSDATGETLITVARAAAAQYANVSPVEHMYPLVRTHKQLDRVLSEIESAPGHRALHAARARAGQPAGGDLPRARPAVPVDPRAGAGAVPVLSRRRDQAARRRPAHAQCRIFQAHRRAELHHAARRRPAHRRSRTGRRRAGRRVAHLEDADLDLSRQPRREDRQRAAGAGRAGAAAARTADAAAGGRPVREPRSASCRSGRTGCSGCAPSTTPISMSTARRWPRRSPSRASSAPGTTGRSST